MSYRINVTWGKPNTTVCVPRKAANLSRTGTQESTGLTAVGGDRAGARGLQSAEIATHCLTTRSLSSEQLCRQQLCRQDPNTGPTLPPLPLWMFLGKTVKKKRMLSWPLPSPLEDGPHSRSPTLAYGQPSSTFHS